ncbi:MAG: OmpA family protein [Deltaproteobacteria bacterium]|nr:OmpA family protein [Deltaproteobacteria bacterium]
MFETKARFRSLLLGVSASALLVGCGIPQEKYDADLRGERERGAAELEAAQQKAAARFKLYEKQLSDSGEYGDGQKKRADDLERELARTKKTLDECSAKGGDKAKALTTCTLEKRALEDRLGAVEAMISKVKGALKAMSDAGKLTVKVDRGFLIIALQGDILFDSGKAKLKEDAKPVLAELAEVLKAMPDRLFQVAGHTDNAGKESTNWRLSVDRALNVVEFLIQNGVAGKGLSAGGYASFQPVGDNTTDDGRAQNRRVEFLLVPNLGEIFGDKAAKPAPNRP